jgi:hypothetical protein
MFRAGVGAQVFFERFDFFPKRVTSTPDDLLDGHHQFVVNRCVEIRQVEKSDGVLGAHVRRSPADRTPASLFFEKSPRRTEDSGFRDPCSRPQRLWVQRSRGRGERDGQGVDDVVYELDVQFGFDFIRYFGQIFFVSPGQNHGMDAGPRRGEEFALDPAHG